MNTSSYYNNILIVKLSAMGDIIHTTFILQNIKRLYPDIKIGWICDTSFSTVLKNNPYIDELIEIDLKYATRSKSIFKLYNIIKRLKSLDYNIAIDYQGLLKSAIVSKLSAKRVIGFDKKSIKEPIATLLYDTLVDCDYDYPVVTRHEVLTKYALNIKDTLSRDTSLFYKMSNNLNKFYLKNKKNIIIFIGASNSNKIYPVSRVDELIKKLNMCNIIITYSNDIENSVALTLQKNLNVTLVDKLNLNDLICLVSMSDLVIGNDSGPTHMAWALKVPSIVLFGCTPVTMMEQTDINIAIKSKISNPTRRNIDKNDFSIDTISSEDIFKMSKELLNIN